MSEIYLKINNARSKQSSNSHCKNVIIAHELCNFLQMSVVRVFQFFSLPFFYEIILT